MQFVYPNFLWALALVAIPIIIHLFYFRRYKKVYFSNVHLLKEWQEQKATRNQLKHLLVLLSRILALIALVFAFAQPYIANPKQKQANKNISIYIDNSFSMNAEGQGQLLIDEAKAIAQNIITTYAKNDLSNLNKYQILSNDFEAKQQHLGSKIEAEILLKDIGISTATQKMKAVYQRQKMLLGNKNAHNISYQISDFQVQNALYKADTAIENNLVKIKSSQTRNVYIDSVWFMASYQLKDAQNTLMVRFRNESNEPQSGNYQFLLNKEVKSVGKYEIPANGKIEDTLYFKLNKNHWNTGKIQLSDYPITFDDQYFFSFFVEEKVKVLAITEKGNSPIFKAVFEATDNVLFAQSSVAKINYNSLNEYHFIVLDQMQNISTGLMQALQKYIAQGGSLFFVPHTNGLQSNYNQFFAELNLGQILTKKAQSKTVRQLNLEHYLLNDLFEKTPKDIPLPTTQQHFVWQSNPHILQENIMNYNTQEPFLSSCVVENGMFYFCNASLQPKISNFTQNSLFAPMVYKMAVFGVGNKKISHYLNAETQFILPYEVAIAEAKLCKLKKIDEDKEYIPLMQKIGNQFYFSIKNTKMTAGIYQLFNEQNQLLAYIALNYNRTESDLKTYSIQDLEKHYVNQNTTIIKGNENQIQEKISVQSKGKSLWKWFILFSLLFLAFEIIILRFYKA